MQRSFRTRPPTWLAAAFLLVIPLGVPAQGPAYRVKDIGTAPAASLPYDLVRVGGRLFFFANGVQGPALWRSDGSPAGTVPVGRVTSLRPWS